LKNTGLFCPDKTETTRLLRSLVRIPSVTGEEIDCANFLRKFFKQHGFKVEYDKVDGHRANVLAYIPGEDEKKGLILNGHIDVVPPGNVGNWRHPPFEGVIHDGRLYGRGASDMKGGVAAMIMAGVSVLESDVALKGDLRIQCVVDEERGSKAGTKRIIEKGWMKGSAAIVPEPSSLNIITACKGDIGLEITVHGKTAHASRPWNGVNAIHKMFDLIRRFQSLPEKEKWASTRNHPILGEPTIGVSVIQGGTQRNMVPDLCRIVLDRRTLPGLGETSQVHGELLNVIKEAKKKDPSLKVDVKTMLAEDAMEVQPDLPLVKAVGKVHNEILEVSPSISGLHGFTDARLIVNQSGIPALVYGPGDLGVAHADNEFVSIDQVHSCSVVLANVAKRLLT